MFLPLVPARASAGGATQLRPALQRWVRVDLETKSQRDDMGVPMKSPPIRFPAEWEPHAATWLAWPHYKNDWPGKFEPIPWVYAEIIRHLGRHEGVELIG